MFYKQTKPYYVQLKNTNQTSAMLTAFTNEGNILLNIYANNSIASYFAEFDGRFKELKSLYPQYKLENTVNVIASFGDALNNLMTKNSLLDEEIISLRKIISEEKCHNNTIGVLEEKQLVQSADIKLVYIQYLLLYDLTLTNGLFIDSYLEDAERILIKNGGSLYYPDK